MTSKEDQQVHAIIFSLAKLFGFKCILCHGKCSHGKGWAIHHRKYYPGEKKYDDFKKTTKTGRVVNDRLAYYKYLDKLIRARTTARRKKDFGLIHNSCHQAVSRLARWKKANRKRLYKLADEVAPY